MLHEKKPGLVAAWYRELKDFQSNPPPRGPLPHLSAGALIVTVLAGSFFAIYVAQAITIIVDYGWHAFFVERLRITDWKHDLLSNGAHLSFFAKLIEVPTTLILMVLLVYGSDFAAMLIRMPMGRGAAWMRVLIHVFGGTGLLLFALNLYRQSYPLIHPVPLAAFIGGAVLIWKASTAIIRDLSKTQK